MSEETKVGAVILAAGASTRFGKPKQLAIFRGESLLQHAVTAAIAAGCGPVVVVAGDRAEEIETAIATLRCEMVVNHEWREGIASSIRAGLQHLATADHDLEAILFLACDQPLVRPEDLRGLIALHKTTGKAVVAAAYADTVGIPALFGRACFPDLLTLTGDRGAKHLILSRPDDLATFDLPAAATDIDTTSDYEELRDSSF